VSEPIPICKICFDAYDPTGRHLAFNLCDRCGDAYQAQGEPLEQVEAATVEDIRQNIAIRHAAAVREFERSYPSAETKRQQKRLQKWIEREIEKRMEGK